MKDIVNITLSALKALGEARLATATKATEFMRVIFGDESTEVALGGGVLLSGVRDATGV